MHEALSLNAAKNLFHQGFQKDLIITLEKGRGVAVDIKHSDQITRAIPDRNHDFRPG